MFFWAQAAVGFGVRYVSGVHWLNVSTKTCLEFVAVEMLLLSLFAPNSELSEASRYTTTIATVYYSIASCVLI